MQSRAGLLDGILLMLVLSETLRMTQPDITITPRVIKCTDRVKSVDTISHSREFKSENKTQQKYFYCII